MDPIQIKQLQPADRAQWEALARGYKAFYNSELPDARYEETWALLMANERVHGLAAHCEGRIAGIAHYLFHPQGWSEDACYLQDLFTAPDARGRGVATALIDAVAEAARANGSDRFYWLTKVDNRRARALYDRIAEYKGFLRYDYRL